jgi:hypothetical protein
MMTSVLSSMQQYLQKGQQSVDVSPCAAPRNGSAVLNGDAIAWKSGPHGGNIPRTDGLMTTYSRVVKSRKIQYGHNLWGW